MSDIMMDITRKLREYKAGIERLETVEYPAMFYNVQKYGAVGDGAADDTAAIQAALDATIAGGGVVLFPPGSYIVSATLTITTLKPLLVLGYGAKLELAANVVAFKINQQMYSIIGAVIEGFEIDGNDAAGTIGVQFYNTARAKVTNCHIHHCATGVEWKTVGTYAEAWTESCQLMNVLIRYCTIGVDFVPGAIASPYTSFGQSYMSNVDIGSCNTGIVVRNYANVYRSTWIQICCWLSIANAVGLRIAGSMPDNVIQFACENQPIETAGTVGIQIDSTAIMLSRSQLHYGGFWNVVTPMTNATTNPGTAFQTDSKPMVIPLIRAAVPATVAATSPNYAALIAYQNSIGIFPIDEFRAAGGLVRVTAIVKGNNAGAETKTMRVQDVTNAITLCSRTWTGNAEGRQSSTWVMMPRWASTEATLELQFTTEKADETILVHDAWLQFK